MNDYQTNRLNTDNTTASDGSLLTSGMVRVLRDGILRDLRLDVLSRVCVASLIAMLSASCTSNGGFDTGKALAIGSGVIQVATLDENEVKLKASLAAEQLDRKSQLVGENSIYAKRLKKITAGLSNSDGLQLNFKVYLSADVNAFAMADGTVRVHSGLLDLMPDDQVLAVIGHEIGHVKLRHSYNQMRETLLTNVAFEAARSVGGTFGQLTAGQLGTLAQTVVNAQFSQADELESDAYAVKILKRLGKDPYAMKRSIETLQKKNGSGGGFMSSHPSNAKRIEKIQDSIDRL